MLNMQYDDVKSYEKKSFLIIIIYFTALIFFFNFTNLILHYFMNAISLNNNFIFSTLIKTQHLDFLVNKCY